MGWIRSGEHRHATGHGSVHHHVVLGAVVSALVCLPLAASAISVEMVCYMTGDQAGQESGGFGTGHFTVDTDANTVSYEIRFGNLNSAESLAHIHGPADADQTASPKHTLAPGPVKIGVWNYDEADEADIVGGRMYVNVHSDTSPGGEIRGQIVDMVAFIDGPQAGTASASEGIGLFMIDTDANTLDYYIAYEDTETAESVAHIHGFSLQEVVTPPLHTLPTTNPKEGTWTYDEGQEAGILDGQTWVNIHSDSNPNGEIRGQITRYLTTIDGDQVPVTTDAVGAGFFGLDQDANELGYYMFFTGLTTNETVSHFHGPAAFGEDAGPLVTLDPGSPKIGVWDYGTNESDVLENRVYVNIHSETFPGGEIRGQVWIDRSTAPTTGVEDWLVY